MQQVLPYHEMSVSNPRGKKIIRLIECRMGDEFYTGDDEFTFVWLFPGTGAFAFDSGTNFMMGNDFMYVNGGRHIKFDDFLTDSKFIMLIVDKKHGHIPTAVQGKNRSRRSRGFLAVLQPGVLPFSGFFRRRAQLKISL